MANLSDDQQNPFHSPKKLQRATMANLSNELILEIIARLPLRYAIQCSLLNKNFNNLISDPSFVRQTALLSSARSSDAIIFHCSGHDPKIFTRFSPEKTPVSITLDWETSILASCNGVLLLRFYSFHYVFNPITCGIRFVDYPLTRRHDVGLAVDFNAQNYHFKLVTLSRKRGPINQSVLRFSVVVPSDSGYGPSTLLKSQVDFVCESFTRMAGETIRPVYAHGCLHWLGENGRKTVSFDVEKEQARIISGPVKNNEPGFHSDVDKWFGFADGSIRFIYTLRQEIVIHSHDYPKDEWQVTHKIANICNPSNNDYRNGVPLFFDGRHLFLLLRKREEDGKVFVHDVLRDKWEKSGQVGGWTDWKQLFFSFSPTLAKVSDKYLHKLPWNNLGFKGSFLGLHQLLRYPQRPQIKEL